MEIRGVRLSKAQTARKNSGLFVLRAPQYFSVPLVAAVLSYEEICERTVKVGDIVKEGSVLAKPSGRYGTFVYSPCCGKVVGIVKKLNVHGNECEHVIIARNPSDEKVTLDPVNIESKESLLKRLYESGMIDSFYPYEPAYKKYLLKNQISKLIINCTEEDPYKTCKAALLENYLSEIIEGAKLLQNMCGAQVLELLFTNRQSKLVKTVREYLKKLGQQKVIKIKLYPSLYPMDDARLLAYYETGKMVSSGVRVATASVIVDDVQNCYDFFSAVKRGIVATQKAVTIAGENVLRSANYFVKNGTPINHILEIVGTKEEYTQNMLIYGGIMSGIAQETADISTTLSASEILFINRDEYANDTESPCINCGKCVAACPVHLHVKNIDEAICERKYLLAKKLGAEACLTCGVCSYVCPAKRQLTQRLSFARDLALNRRRKNPDSSDYVLVEGRDATVDDDVNLETTKAPVRRRGEVPAVDEMLKTLESQQATQNGGESNE